MILAIDIGNTNIAIGGFYGEELRFVARISTDPGKTADEYSSKILHMLSLYGLDRAYRQRNFTVSIPSQVRKVVCSSEPDMVFGVAKTKPSRVVPDGVE